MALQVEGEGVGEAVVGRDMRTLCPCESMADDVVQILGVLLPEGSARGILDHAYGREAVAAVGTSRGLCDTKPDVG